MRLDSPDEALRVSLEETLPALKEHLERPVLALLRAAETAPETRVVAARALGLMGSERAVPELSSVAFETADARLRLAATQALTLIASPEGLPALQGLSLHSSPQVRAEALVGLARIGGPLALSSIEAMALNPREDNARIRREAIAYIGLLGADPSIDTLISVMNRYPQTREEVVAALRRLTGLNLGNSPLEWTQWRYKQQKALEEAQKQEAPSGGVLGISRGRSAPGPAATMILLRRRPTRRSAVQHPPPETGHPRKVPEQFDHAHKHHKELQPPQEHAHRFGPDERQRSLRRRNAQRTPHPSLRGGILEEGIPDGVTVDSQNEAAKKPRREIQERIAGNGVKPRRGDFVLSVALPHRP